MTAEELKTMSTEELTARLHATEEAIVLRVLQGSSRALSFPQIAKKSRLDLGSVIRCMSSIGKKHVIIEYSGCRMLLAEKRSLAGFGTAEIEYRQEEH